MATTSLLRTHCRRIILAIVIEPLRKVYKALGIEDYLRHYADILVHTKLRNIDVVLGVELATETLGYSVAERTIVEDILNPRHLCLGRIVTLTLITRLMAILLDKVEIDNVGIGALNLGRNLLDSIELESIIRVGKEYILACSHLQAAFACRRQTSVLLVYDYDARAKMREFLLDKSLQYLHRAILCTIIHKDKLDILIALTECTLGKLLDILLHPIDWDDKRYFRAIAHTLISAGNAPRKLGVAPRATRHIAPRRAVHR